MTRKLLISLAAIAASAAMYAQPRFDHEVRNDYFAGFGGDKASLERAMAKTEAVLEKDPKHPEALVWHGSGLFFQSGLYFRDGDQQKGMELFGKGIAMMDQAVALAPDSVGVRIPRGAVLLQASLQMPEQFARPLVEKGLADYLRVHAIQKDSLESLGQHPKGELLFGIADAYRRGGNEDKAAEWFAAIAKTMVGSSYAKRAQIWLDTKTLTPAQARCVGCHMPGQ